MSKERYRPNMLLIIILVVVVGQIVTANYLKTSLDAKLAECNEAINTSTLLQGALVNILVEKDIIKRKALILEAQRLSVDFKNMVDQMQQPGAVGPLNDNIEPR